MIVAIIPARGGSRRLPRKNIRDLCGKPLIQYTIDVCRASGVVDKIIVSSEDSEILKIAKSLGADTHHRSEDLARELTGVELELTRRGVLKSLEYKVSSHLFLLPTYPFRSAQHIRTIVESLEKYKYVISQEEILRPNAVQYIDDQNILQNLPENRGIIRKNSYLNGANPNIDEAKKVGRYYRYTVNDIENIDIDTVFDWLKAEYVIKNNLFDFETGKACLDNLV